MKFTFRKPKETVAYLEFRSMDRLKVQLPLYRGINRIGKGIEGFCLYNEREYLKGILEQSQVLIQINDDGARITDFTSTNQTTLIQGDSAKIVWQGLDQEYESIKSPIYFMKGDLPHGVIADDIVDIPWQPFDRRIDERLFFPLYDGNVLCHIYGFMVFRYSQYNYAD